MVLLSQWVLTIAEEAILLEPPGEVREGAGDLIPVAPELTQMLEVT